MEKTKIVLDADVLIHFSAARYLSILPRIFTEYEYIVLSKVYDECKSLKVEIDNICNYLKMMVVIPFAPTGEMLKEYARLTETYGSGESACMAYCKFSHDVIGSSNLKDIKKYCIENKIRYLTTLDFFYHAWKRGLMKENEVDSAISELLKNGHRLPDIKISQYTPTDL